MTDIPRDMPGITVAKAAQKPIRARDYIRSNKLETTSILAGTGALGAMALGAAGAFATMPIWATAGIAAACCYALAKNGDIVVDNATAMGTKMRLSGAVIGAILGAMTSMPELAASVSAVFQGMSGIGIENIAGSNIANPLLILGTTAMIAPIAQSKSLTVKFNYWSLFGTAAVLGALCLYGTVPAMAGAALLAGFAGYNIYMMLKDKAATPEGAPEGKQKDLLSLSKTFNSLWGMAGLAGLVGAASMLVASASAAAVTAGIPASIVGIFFVAVGTSLPELVVSAKAALKGETDTALFNIVGSNIVNVLMVGGAMSAAASFMGAPLPTPESMSPASNIGLLNLGALAGATYLLGKAMVSGKPISRLQGAGWLGLYTAFALGSAHMTGAINLQELIAPATQAITAPAP